MTFATVKDNPYAKKRRVRQTLWPSTFWSQIVGIDLKAYLDKLAYGTDFNERMLSDETVREIGDINERMYGKR